MKKLRWVVLFSISLLISACASRPPLVGLEGEALKRKDYDVVLRVTPIKVKPLLMNTPVDAIEGGAENIQIFDKLVNFKVNDVLLGEYVMIKRGGASRFEQMKDLQQEKNFLKMLTLDYEDPNEEMMKPWISVAVKDPSERFGIENWENPQQVAYRLYLKRTKNEKDSFILKGVRYES